MSKLGKEDIMHKDFNNLILQYIHYKKHNFIKHTYFPSGEKRNAVTGGLLKAKGLARGIPDYLFIGKQSMIWIEFKVEKNKPSKEQAIFLDDINQTTHSKGFVCYTIEEAINILIKENFLL